MGKINMFLKTEVLESLGSNSNIFEEIFEKRKQLYCIKPVQKFGMEEIQLLKKVKAEVNRK